MKTTADLVEFLREATPGIVYRYLVNQGGGMRQCGSISDAFAHIAADAGFEAYISSRPGHFYNVVRVSDGVYEVDMSAIQFEHDPEAEDPDEEIERLRLIIAKDPFRAIRTRRIEEVPSWARLPRAEDTDEVCYAPVQWHKAGAKRIEALMRGEFGRRLDANTAELLGGRPYAEHAVPVTAESIAKFNGLFDPDPRFRAAGEDRERVRRIIDEVLAERRAARGPSVGTLVAGVIVAVVALGGLAFYVARPADG